MKLINLLRMICLGCLLMLIGHVWKLSRAEATMRNVPQIIVTLTPIADTWIDQTIPNTNNNHSTATTLVVAKDEFLQERRGLIRFDLSSIPADAVITSAVLRLYQRNAFLQGESWEINVGKVTSAWSANTVTWATRPETVCCEYAVTTVGVSGVTYDWNVLALVNAWHTAPALTPNFGVELSGGDGAGFYSERQYDSAEGAIPPQLIINYAAPPATLTPTPTSSNTATATPTQLATATSTPSATPIATITSIPGAVRFIDWHDLPIVGTVHVLCYTLDGVLQRNLTVTTNDQGYPQNPTLLAGCDTITALHLRHTQPSGKPSGRPAYWIYVASGANTESSLVPVPPVGDVVLQRPLILFNVVVSLEWDATTDYIAMLREGLGYASTYLADLTEGYMAFGPVTIFANGAQWDDADIRIQTTNDMRPSAYVGGIIATPTEYIIREGADPTFKPAAVFLGRAWDGSSAHQGVWMEDNGFRTLAHEWMHYALFLYDEYQAEDGREIYCTSMSLKPDPSITPPPEDPEAASVMSFQYRASELWHPSHRQEPTAICAETDHYALYHQSDWETVANHWYAIQGLKERADLPPLRIPVHPPAPDRRDYRLDAWGPLGDLFGRSPDTTFFYLPLVTTDGASALPTDARVNILVEEDTILTETIATQVYVYKAPTADTPARLFYEGTAVGDAETPQQIGAIDLWDIAPVDTLYAFVDRYPYRDETRGERFVFADTGIDPSVGTTVDILAKVQNEDSWQYSLDLVYGLAVIPGSYGRLDYMQVRLESPRFLDLHNTPPVAQLCVPEATIGCAATWQQPMILSGTTWIATFAPLVGEEELPLYGLVRITSTHPEFNGIVRWFRDLSGVGLGHMLAGAPLREGWAMVDLLVDSVMPGACNRALIMPTADYQALTTPVTGLASIPLDIDILYGGSDPNVTTCRSDATIEFKEMPTRLTLFYNDEVIRRLGIQESQLTVIHFTPLNKAWQEIQTTMINPELNMVTATITQDGIYAVGWLRP